MNKQTLFATLAAFVIFFAVNGSQIVSAETSQSSDEVAQQAKAQAKRDRGARQACGGGVFEWDSDGAVVCHKEIPQLSKSEVRPNVQ